MVYKNGKTIGIGRGLNASMNGNPIGTVISFMGRIAPEGYLICDGTGVRGW